MNSETTDPQAQPAPNLPEAEGSSGIRRSRRGWLGLAGTGALLVALVRFVPRGEERSGGETDPSPWLEPDTEPSGPSREARIAEARRELAELSRTYQQQQSQETAAARRALGEILEQARHRVGEASSEAAAPFQGLSNATRCAFLGAADRIDGGERLRDYCGEAIAPVAGLARATAERVDALLVATHQASLARTNRFHDDTLALVGGHDLAPAELGLGEGLVLSWQRSLEGLFSKRTTASLATGLELAMISITFRTLAVLLAAAIKRLAQTGTAAALAAAADGPLPIGDIVAAVIAVGGAAWTVHDLHKAAQASKNLPAEIESALLKEFRSLERAASDYLRQLDHACGSAFRSAV